MIYTSLFPLVRATNDARGFDLHADLSDLDVLREHISKLNPGMGVMFEKGITSDSNRMIIPPFKPVRIPTSLRIDYFDIERNKINITHERVSGDIKPNSRALFKNGVYVQLGTIDPDYRGDHLVCLVNLMPDLLVIEHGQVIAQLEFVGITPSDAEGSLHLVTPESFEKFSTKTIRGDKGFGSTEKK